MQQITGASNSMQRRSGNVLPPALDDYCNSNSSNGKPTVKNTSSVRHPKLVLLKELLMFLSYIWYTAIICSISLIFGYVKPHNICLKINVFVLTINVLVEISTGGGDASLSPSP